MHEEIQQLILRSRKCLSANDPGKAIISLTAALSLILEQHLIVKQQVEQHTLLEIYCLRAEAYLLIDFFQSALNDCAEVLKHNAEDIIALKIRGRAYLKIIDVLVTVSEKINYLRAALWDYSRVIALGDQSAAVIIYKNEVQKKLVENILLHAKEKHKPIVDDAKSSLTEKICAQKKVIRDCFEAADIDPSIQPYLEKEQQKLLQLEKQMVEFQNAYYCGIGEKDLFKALKFFDVAIELDPGNKIICAELLKRFEQLLCQELSLDKRVLLRIYRAKALIYTGLQYYSEALFNYSNVLKYDAKDASAYYERGRIKEMCADKQENLCHKISFLQSALGDYQNAIKFFSDNKDYLLAIDRIYEKLKTCKQQQEQIATEKTYDVAVNALACGHDHASLAKHIHERVLEHKRESSVVENPSIFFQRFQKDKNLSGDQSKQQPRASGESCVVEAKV